MTSNLTTSQHDYQKAIVKPSSLVTLSPLRLERATKASSFKIAPLIPRTVIFQNLKISKLKPPNAQSLITHLKEQRRESSTHLNLNLTLLKQTSVINSYFSQQISLIAHISHFVENLKATKKMK